MTLEEFIRQEITRPFEWGVTDCVSTVNRWVENITGVNQLVNNNFIFSSEVEAKEFLSNGLVSLMDKVCKDKFKKTNIAKDGDFGLILLYKQSERLVTCAIKYRTGWFAHTEYGCVFFNNVKVIRAYECRK